MIDMTITINNLIVQYSKKQKPALNIEHLQISEGAVAVIGENGAGKSTLFKALQGFLPLSTGFISKSGSSCDTFSSVQVFQSEQCFENATVKDWIQFQGLLRGVEITPSYINTIINMAKLNGKEKQLVINLSGGQQRNLNLLCATFGDPDLIILDEPTTGLDQEARKEYWKIINTYRHTHTNILLFSSHYMHEVQENADQVIMLSHGKVIATGSPKELIDALEIEYVVIVSKNNTSLFNLEEIEHTYDGDNLVLYVKDANRFFRRYGTMDNLIQIGNQFRIPNMTDVYTLHYYKEKNYHA